MCLYSAREIMKKYTCSQLHKLTKEGAPVMVIRAGLSQPSKLFDELGEEKIVQAMVFQKECAYATVDKVTRETRILVNVFLE